MSEPYLTNLPDIPMNLILGYLDYRSIQVLRKVCRDFRNFIDDVIPASSIKCISFKVNHNRVHLEYREFESLMKSKYRFHNTGCAVTWLEGDEKKGKIMEKEHFVDCFWRDFKIMLKHQKSILENFYIVFRNRKQGKVSRLEEKGSHFIETFIENLERRTQKLQVKSLEIEAFDQNQLTLLTSFDADFIEKIAIFLRKSPEESIVTKEIAKLEIWKKGKTCGIYFFDDETPVTEIMGVIRGKIQINEKMSIGMVFEAKAEFVKIAYFEYYEFHHTEAEGDFPIHEQMTEWFHQPFVEVDERTKESRSKWFFRIRGTQFAIAIYEGKAGGSEKYLAFERLKVDDVPMDANMLLT